jgi:hypothetical protein
MRETSLSQYLRFLARDPTNDAKDEEGDDKKKMLATGAMAEDDGEDDLQLPRYHGRGRSFLGAMARDDEGEAI